MAKVIAIVEDDLDQRENYADVLSSHGYEVRCYADKADAEETMMMPPRPREAIACPTTYVSTSVARQLRSRVARCASKEMSKKGSSNEMPALLTRRPIS